MFYGVTRYSLFSPGSQSWKTSGGGVFQSPAEYRDYLFSKERLQLRAELFLTRSVPALATMAENHDYKHFILYSELLPAEHQERLFAAAGQYPFLIPVEWNEVVRGSGIEEVRPLIEQDLAAKIGAGEGVQPVVWFRLDDDDVLAANYLTRLESYRTLAHVGMAVSFGLGLTAYKARRELVSLREYYHPKSAQGMAFIAAFNPRQRLLSITTPGPHHGVDQVMPVILDSREHMFFQIRHGDQDSTLNASPYRRIAGSLARLEKLPSIRTADVGAPKWPSLMEDLTRGEADFHELTAPGAEPLLFTEDTELTFPLDARIEAGLVEFELEFESAKDLAGGFATITFELRGAKPEDLGNLGLKNGRFGPGRQVWSRQARGVVKYSMLLPDGVSISGITLRGKNKQPADVFIRLRAPRVVEMAAVS
ncbi:glycosyltransferase [Arthrobacter sp. PAMC25284]|uniref:glycosyltransferase n=1 Tax=Arthrobacter sp. PAMC25284 TaxID=2861279 RepID=UPI001C639B95|nr:glycosyltransferase [Arthrobacter sp. PAMC25284]QYF89949.1 putative rhamnosyl transferase [Arthrobacter sp. PAMC25284]